MSSGLGVGECTLCDIYTLVLDICCQQFGGICQLEVVCAPFGRGVGECTLCDIYTLLLIYSANNWGMYVSWIYELVLDIYCQQLHLWTIWGGSKSVYQKLMTFERKTSLQAKRHKPSLLFTSLTILTFITR